MDTKTAATGVYFKHFNYKNHFGDNRVPAFTLAYRFLGTSMEVSVARCSRNDTFVKAKGRDLALYRLVQGDSVTVIPARDADGKLFQFQHFTEALLRNEQLMYTDREGNRQNMRWM